MKKILSLALATTVAVSAIAFSVADASAAPKYWKKGWNGRWNNGGAAAAAVIGGIVGLGILSQAYRPYYYGYGYPGYAYGYPYRYPAYRYSYPAYGGGYNSAHVQWCLAHYRTYNPATNTYFRKVGVPAVCYSPYG
jgi:hypothetical protein